MLDQVDAEVGRPLAQIADEIGEQLHRHALIGADAQPARGAGGEVGQFEFRRGEAVGDRVGVGEHQPTGRREGDGTGATGSVEERLPHGSLQSSDLLADGRLREPEDVGSADERTLLGDGAERA